MPAHQFINCMDTNIYTELSFLSHKLRLTIHREPINIIKCELKGIFCAIKLALATQYFTGYGEAVVNKQVVNYRVGLWTLGIGWKTLVLTQMGTSTLNSQEKIHHCRMYTIWHPHPLSKSMSSWAPQTNVSWQPLILWRTKSTIIHLSFSSESSSCYIVRKYIILLIKTGLIAWKILAWL